jgi:hypothetical protein
MSESFKSAVNVALTGPIFALTFAAKVSSDNLVISSQPLRLAASNSGLLSASHTIARGARMRYWPLCSKLDRPYTQNNQKPQKRFYPKRSKYHYSTPRNKAHINVSQRYPIVDFCTMKIPRESTIKSMSGSIYPAFYNPDMAKHCTR